MVLSIHVDCRPSVLVRAPRLFSFSFHFSCFSFWLFIRCCCLQVYDDRASQSLVYKEMVVSLVHDFVAGRNCCVVVYGPHGTGKTHTLVGSGLPNENDDGDDNNDDDVIDNSNNDERSAVSSLGSCGVSKLHVSNGTMTETASSPTKPPNQVLANMSSGAAVHHRQALSSVTGSFLEETTTTATSNLSSAYELDIDAGAILRTGQSIFDSIRKWAKKTSSGGSSTNGSSSYPKGALTGPPTVRCSYVKVVMDRAVDLLHPDLITARGGIGITLPYVTVQQLQPDGAYIDNATELGCGTMGDVVTALIRGRRGRRTAAQKLGIGTFLIGV